MRQYRIYCLTPEGGFSQVDEINAADDDEAVAYARSLKHSGKCEVWNGSRLVAQINTRSVATAWRP